MSLQRIITLSIPLVATQALLVSCSKKSEPKEPEPRPVITHTVEKPQLTMTRKFNGVSQAADSAELSFEISGRITELPATSGKRYTKGELLAKLDTTTLEAQLRQAQAESTRANEERKRVLQLFETGNASQASLEQAIASQKSAAAKLESATTSVANGTLIMPYDGVIGDVLKGKQEVVSAGTPVMNIQGEGAMEIEVGVTAEVINAIKPGMKAQVNFPAISKDPLSATINKVSPQASENTTYAVTLSVDTSNNKLRDGLDGEVTLSLPNPSGASLHIPLACVAGTTGNQQYVFVIEKTGTNLGIVKKRPVQVGSLSGDTMIEILQGLETGEIILARGIHRIETGTKVRISE